VRKIGIDIGGTFTDLVLSDGDTSLTLKVPSTPDNPAAAALQALQRLRHEHGLELETVQSLAHGTTVATNALIQRRGGKTALITTAGFRDVLEIGRLGRPPQAIYDVHYQRPAPIIPRQLRLEIEERVTYKGEVERPLRPEEVRQLAEHLRTLQVESVAVCFLYSFLHPAHEHVVQEILQDTLPGVSVLCSCDILPERREYERTSTTAISAYLAPTVTRYLERMVAQLGALGLSQQMYIMQSNGGLNTPHTAMANPGSLLLSGPAAGVVAAATLGMQAGFANLLSMDMGGTSFDVALIQDGRCLLSTENRLDEAVFNVPMLDITTIGAGGGSIAWLDKAGKLRVGPQSAGAQPGPACYAQGGEAPTVTDATLCLGLLNPDNFLGGAMRMHADLAERAIHTHLATPLGMSVLQAAAGMYRIVNANMAGAARLVSVEKGYDPRDFALLAFGGAGPLHAVAIAEELEIPWVVVPRYPGMTSAAGLVVADIVHNFVQTAVTEFAQATPAFLTEGFDGLRRRAADILERDGVPPAQRRYDRSLDIKYVGQGYTLNIPIGETHFTAATLPAISERFHTRHEALYGFRADEEPVEIINLRLQATGVLPKPPQRPRTRGPRLPESARCGTRLAWVDRRQDMQRYHVYDRDRLMTGHVLPGPAIVEQVDSTTLIPPGWLATVDGYGNLIVGTEEWPEHA
jgi:N-methylhydantoinase A